MDKRQHLVTTAFELFYREGVHAVGINRVLEAAGVAKKTLYHHFDSKEVLVAAVVEYRDGRYRDWLLARMARAGTGQHALTGLFAALDDWFNDRDPAIRPFHGCFFINVSAEYGDPAHPIHQLCADHKRAIAAQVTEVMAQVTEDPEQQERLAQAVLLLKEGCIVQAHVCGDRSAAVRAGELLAALLREAGLAAGPT